ncbi:MAG: double-strand break repair protein AddB [Devosiaceae bacterium]
MNLFTIGPHSPFLPTLAQSWLDGTLNVGPTDDPLARIDTTFYLPTRRAARAFADALTDRLGGATLLPTIRTLADADDDEFLLPEAFDPQQMQVLPEALEPPNLAAMPGLRRRLILTRLIGAAGSAMAKAMVASNVADQPIFPQSIGESAHLAKALADLIDQVATEETDWSALYELVPDDHAAYWQLTLTLLTLVTQNWPAILAEEDLVEPATRRRLLLDARTARIMAGQHAGPIIAAGSTGSIPATARLLSAIAQARQGAVVLPGLDLTMDSDAFAQLGDDTPQSASHPQHGLSNLLNAMQATREDVTELNPAISERQQLVSAALLPAQATQNWPGLRPTLTSAFDDVALLEAASEGEESLAIAMTMKASIASNQTVALVTPDRNLARRVQLDLQRFDLTSDDSAGTPLRETPVARLMLLASDVHRSGFAAIPLLALLKHPLCALGQPPATTRHQARLLERLALRGIALAPGLDALRAVIHLRAGERDDPSVRQPALRKKLGSDDDTQAIALIEKLTAAFDSLTNLTSEVSFTHYTEALFTTCEALADMGQVGAPNPFYAGNDGEALATLRGELRQADSVGLTTPVVEAPDLLEALLAEGVVRPERPSDPRINIWGPLEARLQTVDHIILGGLNEKAWPNLPPSSPFLSRAMMAGLGLATPERRIGLSAHDVEQALGMARITLTRSKKVDGTPTVRSRWLQRLLAFLPAESGKAMQARVAPTLALAANWDSPAKVTPRPRPEPRPENPPRALSITEVETLIRDPYTVYVRRVLKLEEAPGLGLPPGPSERGTLFHALFEHMAPHLDALPPENWPQAMSREADKLLTQLGPFPDIQALWARRIERVQAPYLATEHDWQQGLEQRLPEVRGRLALDVAGHACTLTGRADRIDRYRDGTASILDFKTGNPPSKNQVATFAAQLPLSVAMLAEGAFEGLSSTPARAARYVQAGGNRTPFKVTSFEEAGELIELASNARAQLVALWAIFLMGAPFLPLVRPERAQDQGPFHHLARVKEWRAADDGEDGA